MDCKAVWTQNARDDVDRAVRYISGELGSPTAARDLLDALEKDVEEITTFPEMCPIHPHPSLASRELRAKFVKRHVILYRHDGEEVLIYRVFHTLQDYARLITKS